ncbi:glucosaminidase domain-containing protein [Lacticigenium naphthae]|uniref:glucosaminidase domain-containing protein n=1 Tax=Lacticigenium naphthae TaxID=515351 RepID=UPI00041B7135|nr:glucosaminidase domain-containing protein [Lacticigenium naphthae]
MMRNKLFKKLVVLTFVATNFIPSAVMAVESQEYQNTEEEFKEPVEEKTVIDAEESVNSEEETIQDGAIISDDLSNTSQDAVIEKDSTYEVIEETNSDDVSKSIDAVVEEKPQDTISEDNSTESQINTSDLAEIENTAQSNPIYPEVYSVEENRKKAMDIMEEDGQQSVMMFRMASISPTQSFLDQFAPLAKKYATQYNLYPSVMLAQAILESGWGNSSLSQPPYHQMFGIKASGDFSGDYITVPTQEWIVDKTHPEGGYYITIMDEFRVYPSYDEAFLDQANFLQKTRYKNVNMSASPTYRHATQALKDAGYATDPNYPHKLNAIISRYKLYQYDPTPTLNYQSHVQRVGDQKNVQDGQLSGTVGESRRIEAIQFNIKGIPELGIQYAGFVESQGWTDWMGNGTWIGTKGKNQRIESVKMKLTGSKSDYYDIYYRIHVEKIGWMDWAKNGEITGTELFDYRIEAIEAKLVPKISYAMYNSKIDEKWSSDSIDGKTLGGGTSAFNFEALKVNLENTVETGNVRFISHLKGSNSDAWLSWQNNGQDSGIMNSTRAIDAMKIVLEGEMAYHFDVYYRVNINNKGWQGWNKNGTIAGNINNQDYIVGMQSKLVPKDYGVSGGNKEIFRKNTRPILSYQTHIETSGWQGWFNEGDTAGSTGLSRRLESIQIKLDNLAYSGAIEYKAHVEKIGWQNWVRNGSLSGTTGERKRLEAIQIRLVQEVANDYDVYYRVHSETYGWLDWAKNGEPAGTEGKAKRLEAIEIILVEKNGDAPGIAVKPFVK